ncbi:unnamed protein product, partial [marine sediment metagenome]
MSKTHLSGPLNINPDNEEGTILDCDAFGVGAVLGATMTISPESAAESGYIRMDIAGTIYQIP